MAKRRIKRNPAVSAAQYRLAEAVAHGTARTPTRMTKAAAQEIIARTPANLRSKFMKHNPHRKRNYSALPGDSKQTEKIRKLAARLKVPFAVAAAAYSASGGDLKKAAAMARQVKGRSNPHRKRNPEDAAAAAYEEFHGKPPEIVTEVDTPIRYHKNVAGLGKLKYLDVARESDGKVVHLSFDSKTYLTENEARNQLFITGGDQSIDLQTFGISTPHEYQVLGKVVAIGYFTEKKHLISKDGGRGTYDHPFGYTRKGNREVKVSKSCPPTLIYDTRNELLSFAGGSYTIEPEGIDG